MRKTDATSKRPYSQIGNLTGRVVESNEKGYRPDSVEKKNKGSKEVDGCSRGKSQEKNR